MINPVLALFIWPAVALLLFGLVSIRKAIVLSLVLAWLFLPVAQYSFPGFPDYSKTTAASCGVLLGVLVVDLKGLLKLRPVFMDFPVCALCLAAFASAVVNGFGTYDAISWMCDELITWGIPYIIGRLYFRTFDDLRELAIGLFIGGLIYVPFCLYEIRMSPGLHNWIYGFQQHQFAQTKRYGGWRPMVFMQHGLMVGMWMCSTGLIGLWLWLSAAARRVFGCPIGIAASVLVVTAILCKSFGAIALLFAGGVALLFVRHARSAIVVWGLVAMAPTYMVARAYFGWNPQAPVEWVESIGGEQRAGSWQVRLDTEDDFIRAAWQKPFFGWRHWGDSRAVWRNGRAVPDGLWTLTLVQMGFPALVALTALFLIPVILFVRRYPSNTWMSGAVAPAAALALVLALYLIDCLSNAMVNPLFTLAAGGLTSLVVTAPAGIESAQLRRKPSRAHSRRSGRTTKPVGAT